jgi:hypothetical protein
MLIVARLIVLRLAKNRDAKRHEKNRDAILRIDGIFETVFETVCAKHLFCVFETDMPSQLRRLN